MSMSMSTDAVDKWLSEFGTSLSIDSATHVEVANGGTVEERLRAACLSASNGDWQRMRNPRHLHRYPSMSTLRTTSTTAGRKEC